MDFNGIGATNHTRQEIQCLPYAGVFYSGSSLTLTDEIRSSKKKYETKIKQSDDQTLIHISTTQKYVSVEGPLHCFAFHCITL